MEKDLVILVNEYFGSVVTVEFLVGFYIVHFLLDLLWTIGLRSVENYRVT